MLDFDGGEPVIGARVALWQHFDVHASEVVAVTTGADGRLKLTASTYGGFSVKIDGGGCEPTAYCCSFTPSPAT